MLITTTGGLVGIVLGIVLSQLVGVLAGWSTIVTLSSIALAFFVSVSVGIVFGVYPAVRILELHLWEVYEDSWIYYWH